MLSSGKDHIDCQSAAKAEYLKIWLESGIDEVKVPQDESYISKILPELKALKEKIDRIISDHISSLRAIGHHQPEDTENDYAEIAGRVVWIKDCLEIFCKFLLIGDLLHLFSRLMYHLVIFS